MFKQRRNKTIKYKQKLNLLFAGQTSVATQKSHQSWIIYTLHTLYTYIHYIHIVIHYIYIAYIIYNQKCNWKTPDK